MKPSLFHIVRWAFLLTPLAVGSHAAPAIVPTPRVLHAGLVAPTVLGLTIEDGTLIRAGQGPYTPEPGDEIKIPSSTYTPANTPQLWRKGAYVGWLLEKAPLTVTPSDRLESDHRFHLRPSR